MTLGGLQPLYRWQLTINETVDASSWLMPRLEARVGHRIVWHLLSTRTQEALLSLGRELGARTPRRLPRYGAIAGLIVAGAWTLIVGPLAASTPGSDEINWVWLFVIWGLMAALALVCAVHLVRAGRRMRETWDEQALAPRLEGLVALVRQDLAARSRS